LETEAADVMPALAAERHEVRTGLPPRCGQFSGGNVSLYYDGKKVKAALNAPLQRFFL
jgi:hypothetical protein